MPVSVGEAQDVHYGEGHDYRVGSPHLEHRRLYEFLVGLITSEADRLLEAGVDGGTLEVGAGDGAITERLLAHGLEVTATEVSRASAERLAERFRRNPSFEAIHDPQGELEPLGARRFALVVFASVLHHIPDYIAALERAAADHLSQGGTLLTIQDPLFYPRMKDRTRWASSGSYLFWRLRRPGLVRGLRTRARRATAGLSETIEADAVEYHVVRDGVDEVAIAERLASGFRDVEVIRYWSTQSALAQAAGTRLGLENTFALRAYGYAPAAPPERA